MTSTTILIDAIGNIPNLQLWTLDILLISFILLVIFGIYNMVKK